MTSPVSRHTPRRIVVQKFGGTSLGTPELIVRAAHRAMAQRRNGTLVVMVVSAMAGETDRLLALARTVSGSRVSAQSCLESDVIAATGEQVSAGLMALALGAAGASARSWLGHQLPIRTSAVPGSAEIESVDTSHLLASLEVDEIPVVAGFQGVDCAGNITTLGRGGSDTTAVAVAAALGAACEIYTDVDGVYTMDPRICDTALRLPVVGYRTMHTLAAAGAKVLETRCVDLAMRYQVPVHVRSSMTTGSGTWIVDEEGDPRTKEVVGVAIAGVTFEDAPCARVSVIGTGLSRISTGADRVLARIGVTPLGKREGKMGFEYFVRVEDGAATARALHGDYAVARPLGAETTLEPRASAGRRLGRQGALARTA